MRSVREGAESVCFWPPRWWAARRQPCCVGLANRPLVVWRVGVCAAHGGGGRRRTREGASLIGAPARRGERSDCVRKSGREQSQHRRSAGRVFGENRLWRGQQGAAPIDWTKTGPGENALCGESSRQTAERADGRGRAWRRELCSLACAGQTARACAASSDIATRRAEARRRAAMRCTGGWMCPCGPCRTRPCHGLSGW